MIVLFAKRYGQFFPNTPASILAYDSSLPLTLKVLMYLTGQLGVEEFAQNGGAGRADGRGVYEAE